MIYSSIFMNSKSISLINPVSQQEIDQRLILRNKVDRRPLSICMRVFLDDMTDNGLFFMGNLTIKAGVK